MESKPISVKIIYDKNDVREEQYEGTYHKQNFSYNDDVYIHEGKSTIRENLGLALYWYHSKKDPKVGNWRLCKVELDEKEDSLRSYADPKSEDLGCGDYYTEYNISNENKHKDNHCMKFVYSS